MFSKKHILQVSDQTMVDDIQLLGFLMVFQTGIVSLLVSLLLQNGPPRNNKDSSIELSSSLVHIAHVCVNIINNIAALNLVFLQVATFHLLYFQKTTIYFFPELFRIRRLSSGNVPHFKLFTCVLYFRQLY